MNNYILEAAKILTDPDFFRAAVNFTAQRKASAIIKRITLQRLIGILGISKQGSCI
jgi:hypothetical protein